MGRNQPFRDWATWGVRAVLLAGLGYIVASWSGMQSDIASLKADVAFIKGRLNGGRGDR